MTSSDTSSQAVQLGDILAEKYRVDRVLGQGGMGVVVLAEHLELRERVAIKFLLDTSADNVELSERFLREARSAVKIKSEHVVRVIDVGRLPTGAPYMVMEYLEGEDLSQRLLAGRVPVEDAVDYLIQACEAMHVAHRAGIVHRDLKPANLFLTQRPDGSSLIKVLDFGISKVKSADPSQLSLTHTQAMMGSPLYMSPEQMRSSKDVSPSADIWSLGVILHELIAGDVPFTGSTFPEVLVQVMSEDPPRLRSLRPEVPESLETVVLRCLEKNPADRYSSVAALGVALAPHGSPRTLGLQQRLRSNLSRPAPPAPLPPAPPKLLQVTNMDGGAPIGTAPTAPAPAPAPGTLPGFIAAAGEHLPSKTNTAWGEQYATGASGAGISRRRWLIGGGALAALAIAGLGLFRVSSAPSSSASPPAPSAAAARDPLPPIALPHALPSAPSPPAPSLNEPRVTLAPSVTPSGPAELVDSPTALPAASDTAKASDEHTPAATPTTDHEASKSTPRAATRSTPRRARASTGKTVRAQAAPAAAATRTGAASTTRTPAPAAAASASTRSKPLSIEFK